MGWRGTAILAIALLAAAFSLYREVFADRPDATWRSVIEAPRPIPPGEQLTHLIAFDPAAVTTVRLRRGDRRWVLRRGGDGWDGARRARDVDDFLAALGNLAEILPLEVAAGELADHGLDPPESVIEIERSDGPPLSLLIGHRNPPATGVYVQLGPGGPVALAGALLLGELETVTRAATPASQP